MECQQCRPHVDRGLSGRRDGGSMAEPVIRDSADTSDDTGEPFFRVVRGNPAPDEIAALVVALMSRDSEQDAQRAGRTPRRRATWVDPAHQHRHPWHRRYPERHG
jgi:hypothetical protein